MTRMSNLAARRELLVTRAELERLEVALAWQDIRRILRPRHATAPSHPWLARALSLAIPLLGAAKAKRLSRYLSVALLAWRLLSGLRRPRPMP